MLTAERTTLDVPASTPRPAASYIAWVIFGALILAGIVARVAILTTSLGTINSDEAVVGLMARHMLHGEFSAFYWGQPYGGTGEQMPFLPFFAIFGVTATTLKLMTITYSAICAVLVWRISRYLMSRNASMIAAATFWVYPGPTAWWSAKPAGFYWLLMTCGLGTILLGLNIEKQRPTRWNAAWRFGLLGFAIGVGWWCNPQIAYFALPTGIYLVARNWRFLTWLPVTVATAVIGASPWIVSNLRNDFASFNPPPGNATYIQRLEITFSRGLPSLFGTKALYTETWVGGRVGQAAFVVLAALCVVGMVLLARKANGWPVVGMLAIYPFVVALTPTSDWVGEGRYMVFAAPLIVIALCRLIDTTPAAYAIPVVGTALTAGMLVASVGHTAPVPGVPVPNSTQVLRSELRRNGITHAMANYWVAYRVTFETGEKVVVGSLGPDRTPFYTEEVQTDPRAAIIIMSAAQENAAYRTRAETVGDIRRIPADGFDIYIPTGTTWPTLGIPTPNAPIPAPPSPSE